MLSRAAEALFWIGRYAERAEDTARLLDVQWATEHLVSLGTVEVSRPDYLALLARALDLPDPFATLS